MAGSAVLLRRGNYRRQFADFLDRLAVGTAHADEEWVETESVCRCAEVLAETARRYCR